MKHENAKPARVTKPFEIYEMLNRLDYEEVTKVQEWIYDQFIAAKDDYESKHPHADKIADIDVSVFAKRGFKDNSYVNDLSARFDKKLSDGTYITVWVGSSNSEELKAEGLEHRFAVEKYTDDYDYDENLFNSNSLEEVLAYVDKYFL